MPERTAIDWDPDAVPDYAALSRLDGRAVLVAGAGSGIGRQCAHALSAFGARVACVDRETALAETVAGEVGGVALVGDITDTDDVDRLVAEVQAELGPLRAAVDIVGLARYGRILDTTDEDLAWSLQVNLAHIVAIGRACGRAIAEAGGGSVTFIGSVSGLTAADNHAFYGMCKAAIASFSKSAAVELGADGVRVNVVAPGATWTPRVAAALADNRASWDAVAPTGRMSHPSDVAAAVAFLATDLAAQVTGQTLVVDGGASITSPYAVTSRGL